MRLWSIHPQYLDTKGLLALWREGLLAQQVLLGKTKGYKYHPQLIRFRQTSDPILSIVHYLHGVCNEARRRNYQFDQTKIIRPLLEDVPRIPVSSGQVAYEFNFLKQKLRERDTKCHAICERVKKILLHPSFRGIPGNIEPWEKVT